MARTTKAKAADDAAVEAVSVDAGKDMNEDAKNETVETKVEQPVAEKEAAVAPVEQPVENKAAVVEAKVEEPLQESTEIEVIAMIPNVRYHDTYTGDYYAWDNVGQVEYMTFETIERMWRNSKGYFRNMWLKPNDDRVIKKFGLKSIYDKYDFLMDEDNYTNDKIEDVYEQLSSASKELKFSVCNKIKNMVAYGKITNIHVIKGLESRLQIDLTSFI